MKRPTGGPIGIYGGINGVASMDQDANNQSRPEQTANLEKHQRQRVKRLKMKHYWKCEVCCSWELEVEFVGIGVQGKRESVIV